MKKLRQGVAGVLVIAFAIGSLSVHSIGRALTNDFVRGDANDDGRLSITDPLITVRSLFSGGSRTPCDDAVDANDDGEIDLADAIFTLSFLFRSGPAPPPPGLECGPDATNDSLPCPDGDACKGDVWPTPPTPEERDAEGRYGPYHTPGEMRRPRYLHEMALTRTGIAVIFGGTDERGFSAIDSVELFDANQVDREAGSGKVSGVWIDTDFEGNPIASPVGPRIRFTVNRLADGKMLVAGGAADLLGSPARSTAEIFDPETRRFEALASEMIVARFRHTAVPLPDGTLLLVGGQTNAAAEAWNGFPRPQQLRFPTTRSAELFSLVKREFFPLTLLDSDLPSLLASPRGRSGHAMAPIAGSDGQLGTGDDVFLVVGGFQTPDDATSPGGKMFGAVGRGQAGGETSIEVFDPTVRIFTRIASPTLASPRINDPQAVNLGRFNDSTPDGVRGMGNLLLVTHGNDDATFSTVLEDELLAATFTGFGPAQGLQLFRVTDGGLDGHAEGAEYKGAAPPIEPRANRIGRAGTNPVVLPRALQTAPGVAKVVTWVVAVGGVDFVPAGDHAEPNFGPTVRAGCAFDPYFSLRALLDGHPARDLVSARSAANPSGVVGSWLVLDGELPNVGADGLGTTPVSAWARPAAARRVHSKNFSLPGKDGIIDTPDDLVLLSGGSTEFGDWLNAGGEPTAPSAEILVPPGANAPGGSP